MIEIKVQEGPLAGIEADVLVVLGFEEEAPAAVDDAAAGWARRLYGSGEFSGQSRANWLCFIGQPGLKAKRLALARGREARQFDANEMRKAGRRPRFGR